MSSRWPAIAALLGTTAIASALAVGGRPPEHEPSRSREAAPAKSMLARPSGAATEPAEAAPGDDPALHAARPAADPLAQPVPPPAPLPIAALEPTTAPRFIAAASGPVPELNQVSLEQDIALAAEVLGPGGRVLFGAGPGTPTVQVLAEPHEVDPVVVALGELFSPRGGRDLRYRETRLVSAPPATAAALLGALDHALAGGPEPLLVYLGGHGNRGDVPQHNTVSLWAQSELSVVDLAAHLDQSPRPVRMVITTCFSGGFAELVFRGADEAQGSSPNERCGLFAAPWDLEATGCDPNPDRATHDGYGLHFLEALRGNDREGKALPLTTLDLDHDGQVSLLEAHTRARIASTSADVPTSTSERWLRYAAPSEGPQLPLAMPEEDAVIEALAERLALRGREGVAALELQRLDDDLEATMRELDDAQLIEEAAYRIAAADLLARWPMLDDPWHPDQPRLLARHHDAIAGHLEQSESWAQWLAAREDVAHLDERSWDLRRSAAPYERLARALENRELAARLHAEGGEGWAVFERIARCERGLP